MKIFGKMDCITFTNKSWPPIINVARQDPITIMAIEIQPFLLVIDEKYSVDQNTVYNTLCGLLITLMCQFALKIGTSLKLQPNPKSFHDVVKIINQEPPQFLLRQADVTILNFYNMNQALFKKIKYFTASNVIDYQALSHIAYKAYPGKIEEFSYFKFFDSILYPIFLVTVMLISINLMLINNRLNFVNFINNIEILYTVLITSIHLRYLVKGGITMKTIMVLSPWFFTAFLIKTVLENLILDNMERVIPNQVIDSWEDLENNKHVKIISENVEFFVQFSKMSNSKMAANFRSRLQEFNLKDVNNMTVMYGIANDLFTGRAAYVKNKLTIVFHMVYLQTILKLSNNLLDSLHLSKYGGPDEQYFIIIPSTTPKHLAHIFNS